MMPEFESLAADTCRNLLNATHLKAICRHRGFSPPGGGKEALAAFVAPRLLEPVGVAAALASLGEPWLLVLHLIALSSRPPGLAELRDVFTTAGGRPWRVDHRALFGKLADGLLSRGLVLVEDRPVYTRSSTSRFERLVFHLPPAHRALLPPFPASTRPMGQPVVAGDPLGLCREVLQAAVSRAGSGEAVPPPGLVGRVVAAISFKDQRLGIEGCAAPDLETFLRRVRAEWVRSGDKAARGGRGPSAGSGPALAAGDHVLSHLAAGAGVTVADLGRAIASLGLSVDQDVLSAWCEDGNRAGFLLRSGQGTTALYAGAPAARTLPPDGPLVFRAGDRGIQVDLARTGLGPLLELAALCRVEVKEARLLLLPDIVRLGRAGSRLGSLQVLQRVRAASTAFDRAVEHVESRQGKLLFHEGLVLLRIEDLGLRALLSHHLGDRLRALDGPYLAVLGGAVTEVESLVRKEGYAPRRVS